MKRFKEEFSTLQLEDKKGLQAYTLAILEPLKSRLSRQNTRLQLGNISSQSPDQVSQIEGFSRILWGLGALTSSKPDDEWWKIIRKGLIHGTDPKDKDYFGDLEDFDQRLVETAAIAYAIVLRPDCIYEPLSKKEKENLIAWLRPINQKQLHRCNWQWFRVMVDIAFKTLGLDYEKESMFVALDEIERYHVSAGWYKDGMPKTSHADYYIPFAMHYYGMFYAKYMEDVDPERAKKYKERASQFANDYIYYFSENGAAIPYGRSLTYRFAQVAFWSMVVFTGVKTRFSKGQVKGIILRHIRWWNQQAIFDADGCLTLGYAYPNQFMAEDYNASGSAYWALKTMVILALPDDDEFWTVEEEPFPEVKPTHLIRPANMLACHEKGKKQVLFYNGGNYHTNGHTHVECKYEKFVYSTHFGFSVPRSVKTLEAGAYDGMLAVSEDGKYYRHKETSTEIHFYEKYFTTRWKPFRGVEIDTHIVYGFPWHIRIHEIFTKRPLKTADGGFAFGLETLADLPKTFESKEEKEESYIASQEDYSGIRVLKGKQKATLIKAASNTNLMNSRTMIPTLLGEFEEGYHFIASLVYGDEGRLEDLKVPEISIRRDEDDIILNMGRVHVEIPRTKKFS